MRTLLTAAVVLGLAVAAPVRADDEPVSLAHIRLRGDLDETPVAADPLFASQLENFKSKLDRIKKAKNDPKIKGLYLQIDSLEIGWGKVDELRAAIEDFKSSKKKAVAFLESAEPKEYLVALACDFVCMPEGGWLMLTGLRAEVSFYKDLLDKIGAKADMLQQGDFKGAAEPLIRNSMSPQLRKQFDIVLDDYFNETIVGTIVKSRPAQKWTAEQVKHLIDEAPFTAKRAVELGFVDAVAYSDEFFKRLEKEYKTDNVKIVRNYAMAKPDDLDLSNPFALLKLLSPPKPVASSKPKVAVIYAVGGITTGRGGESLMGGNVVGSTTMIEAIRQAEKDRTVKAIVLRVDSPGGSALASDLIWHELTRCTKPVVASMGDTAASGGYYIAMAAKKIYAEPSTLTGSIGVVGGKIVLGGTFEKLGIKTEVISRGANSGIFSSTEGFTPKQRDAMTALMKDTYEQFLDKAIAGRKNAGVEMTKDRLLTLAGGRIWTGRQAKASGLIDELGTLNDAVTAAWVMAGQDKNETPEQLALPKPKNFLDRIIDMQSDLRAPALRGLLNEVPELAGVARSASALLHLRGEPVWVVLPYRFDVK